MAVPAEWQRRLTLARTPEDVVRVSRDYIAGCTPEGLAKVSMDFSSDTLRTAEDVGSYAFELVQQQLASDAGAVELHNMAEFFVAASQRVTQLLTKVPMSRESGS